MLTHWISRQKQCFWRFRCYQFFLFARKISRIFRLAIDSDICMSQCFTKLKQFIEKHYARVFWPDLASRKTLKWLTKQKIPFVLNPPNVSQVRSIENFWAALKRMVYDNGWKARNDQRLISRTTQKLKEIDINTFQNLIRDVCCTLRKIEYNGPLCVLWSLVFFSLKIWEPPDWQGPDVAAKPNFCVCIIYLLRIRISRLIF